MVIFYFIIIIIIIINIFLTISFDKALEIDSNFSEAWNNKGNALDSLGIIYFFLIVTIKLLPLSQIL